MKVAKIIKKGPCEVFAKDIECSDDIEIINPESYICTVEEGGFFQTEFVIKNGKGYVPASNHEENTSDRLLIDALFSPIRNVNYNISDARIGKNTDYDKLTMEVFTDGSILPEQALGIAAKIIKEQISIFISFSEEIEPKKSELIEEENTLNSIL